MSRFASPIAPGQLAGPDPATQNAIRGAGQFAQQNQDRNEQARQANMANQTQRAGMAQQGELARSRMQFEGDQAGMQRQHEMGMQSADMQARQKLDMDRQAFEAAQADEDRKLQRELEAKAREASNKRLLLEQKAMLAPLEARQAARDQIRAAHDEELAFQSALSVATIEAAKGNEALSSRLADLRSTLGTSLMGTQKYETGGKNASEMGLEAFLTDVADLKGIGVEVSEVSGLMSYLEGVVPGMAFARGGNLDEALGLDSHPGPVGLGARHDVSGDINAIDAKMRRTMVENALAGLRVSGIAPAADDADVIDAVVQVVEKARAYRDSHAAGSPIDPGELMPLLQKVSGKVPDTALYSLFENLGQMAESRAIELKQQLLMSSGADGLPTDRLGNIRLALQLRGLEQFAGIDNVFHSALRGKVMRSEPISKLLGELSSRTTADLLDEEDLLALPSTIAEGADVDLVRQLLSDPRARQVMEQASRVKGAKSRQQSLELDAPRRGVRMDREVEEAQTAGEIEAIRRLIAETESML